MCKYGDGCICVECDESAGYYKEPDDVDKTCIRKTCEGVEVCTSEDGIKETDGIVCCTTDNSGNVVHGLCVSGECEYKQCTGNEKQYVYYNEYYSYPDGDFEYSSIELKCCTLDPLSTPAGLVEDDAYGGLLCCPDGKTFHDVKKPLLQNIPLSMVVLQASLILWSAMLLFMMTIIILLEFLFRIVWKPQKA